MSFDWLLLLLLPSLGSRALVLHQRTSSIMSWICGLASDIFVHAQLLFICLPLLSVSWFIALIFFVAELDILFDAFLCKNTGMRMEVAFFSFLDDIRHFWDSAKEKGINKFLPLPLILLGYCFALFHLTPPSVNALPILLILAASGVVSILGMLFLPKKIGYEIDNILFQQEVALITQLVRKWKKSELVGQEPFLPKNEIYSLISHDYPLLRHTQGFTGDKVCDIDVAEKEKPHVVFLFMESFRSKDVGALGGEYNVTPNFDRIAKEGVLFKNFYGNSIKTSRSCISSLFGVPSDVDASEVSSDSDLPLISVADILRENDYHTAYLHNGPIEFENQRDFFLHHGFDAVKGKSDLLREFPDAPASSWGVPDEFLMDYAIDYLKEQKSPSFLTLFTITNHHPWKCPASHTPPKLPDDINPLYKRYLQTFHYSDEALGHFINRLHDEGLAENTLLFILGDHGQPMGEHGDNFIEQRSLYEENIHVPLLLYAPKRIDVPRVISSPASQCDLIPTLMDVLNIQGEHHSIGSSLLRQNEDRIIYFHNPYVFGYFGARKGPYKFIYTKSSKEVEVYNLDEDPNESENIAMQNEELVRELLPMVKQYRSLFKSLYTKERFSPLIPRMQSFNESLAHNAKRTSLSS